MADRYRQAGVDLDAADAAKRAIRDLVRSTFDANVVGGIGGFGGLYAFNGTGRSVLVASADSVGTKVKLAIALDHHLTIGADLVNHCVNDILACGARPLFFLDYLGVSGVDQRQIEQLVAGVAAACRENGCALIGGETAVLPDLYRSGEYDLAGFIVGTVERDHLIDGQAIRAGDALLGLPSNGLHTNGYSLARRLLGLTGEPAHDRPRLERQEPSLGTTWAEALMAVHRSYLAPVSRLLEAGLVRGLAHITGGGLVDNLPRILSADLAARLWPSAWPAPPIFAALRRIGDLSPTELYRVFNMGLGMIVVCAAADVTAAQVLVPEALVVGEVQARVNLSEQVTIVL